MSNKNITTVKDLVNFAAENHGEKDFCKFFRDEEIEVKNFAEFREDCLAVSRYIKTIEKEKMHIAFIGKTSYEYIACLTGMICSGNVVVPFDPNISVEEACTLFQDADIQMLFCEEEFLPKAEEIQKTYKGIRQVVSLGDWHWFDNIFKTYSAESEYAHLSDTLIDPYECALIIYTSGTTGERKGVMLTNSNLISNSCYDTYKALDGEICLSVLPMHHVFCYACDVLKVLYDGTTICLNGALPNIYRNFLIFEPTNTRIVPLLCKAIITKIKISEKIRSLVGHPQNGQRFCPGQSRAQLTKGVPFPKSGKFTGKKSAQTCTHADSHISKNVQQSQDSFFKNKQKNRTYHTDHMVPDPYRAGGSINSSENRMNSLPQKKDMIESVSNFPRNFSVPLGKDSGLINTRNPFSSFSLKFVQALGKEGHE